MDLHRDLTDPEVERDLLVQAPARHFLHDLALARGQRAEATCLSPGDTGHSTLGDVALDSELDRVQHRLASHRLRQEIDRPCLHCLDGHGNIAMAADEDDGLRIATRGQLALEIQSAQAGHTHVQDETTGPIGQIRLEQLAGRAKTDRIQLHRFHQFDESQPNSLVIVDNDDKRCFRAGRHHSRHEPRLTAAL